MRSQGRRYRPSADDGLLAAGNRPAADRARRPRGALRAERGGGPVGLGGSIVHVTVVTETLRVSGVRCERCVGRLAVALRGHDGLEAANANLLGEVTLAWDDDRTSRDEIVSALARAGFHEAADEWE